MHLYVLIWGKLFLPGWFCNNRTTRGFGNTPYFHICLPKAHPSSKAEEQFSSHQFQLMRGVICVPVSKALNNNNCEKRLPSCPQLMINSLKSFSISFKGGCGTNWLFWKLINRGKQPNVSLSFCTRTVPMVIGRLPLHKNMLITNQELNDRMRAVDFAP